MSVKTVVGRVWRHALWRAERAYTRTADRLRRGDRSVIMTPPIGPRFGNLVYLWLSAYQRTADGHPTVVLASPEMEQWWSTFPKLRDLTVETSQVRFHDRREWDGEHYYQRFGVDFRRDALEGFVHAVLAQAVAPGPPDRLVVNVRRGDYYDHPHRRERYGFDQIAYIERALPHVESASVLVVSDDEKWCREHVDPLLRTRFATIDYLAPDPVSNFLAIAGARWIIGTNSTFSYWAAYVAGVVQPDGRVVMPALHDRRAGGAQAYQLDPRWIVLDIPD